MLLAGAFALLAAILAMGAERAQAAAPDFTLQGEPLASAAEVKTVKAGAILDEGMKIVSLSGRTSALGETRADRDATIASGVWNGLRGTIRIERATKGDRAAWPNRINNPSELFASTNPTMTTYLVTRTSRQSFPWGEAVTALTQESQLHYYSPSNEALSYELRGITSDGKHLICAKFGVKLAGLPATWEKSRAWGDDAAKAAADPDVKRLNTASAGSFSPSLQAIDNLLGTLAEAGKAKKR